MPTCLLTEKTDRVMVLTLNRSEQMNALSATLIRELGEAIAVAREDPEVHVVVITGAGRAFSAGADLSEALNAAGEPAVFRAFISSWREVFCAIEECPKPVLAGVNGIAIAGGLELALSCDFIIASSSAKLGDGHIKYGLVPGGGGSRRLPDAIGSRMARWLMYTGALLDADQAQAIGLVQHVLVADGFRERLFEIANSLSVASLPALSFMKRQTSSLNVTRDGLDLEIEAAVRIVTGADAKEGLAAFTEKREPRFPAPTAN